jgi:hypothetical protein
MVVDRAKTDGTGLPAAVLVVTVLSAHQSTSFTDTGKCRIGWLRPSARASAGLGKDSMQASGTVLGEPFLGARTVCKRLEPFLGTVLGGTVLGNRSWGKDSMQASGTVLGYASVWNRSWGTVLGARTVCKRLEPFLGNRSWGRTVLGNRSWGTCTMGSAPIAFA